MTGLKPREFCWVIQGRLAVSERIGGYGIQHRRVRREEEILWLKEEAGITTIFSLLGGMQNLASYRDSGFDVRGEPLIGEYEPPDVQRVFDALDEALTDPQAVLLVHRISLTTPSPEYWPDISFIPAWSTIRSWRRRSSKRFSNGL